MSSVQWMDKCPKCGQETKANYIDSSSPEDNYELCLNCGYKLSYKESKATLQEVNDYRSMFGLEELDKLGRKHGNIPASKN